ncbi:hypothetical protein AQUCO_05800054v1 [Aquilegia coerulea]|uniref:FAR1 domain-containing protein n=1 Tax=Aquilegia coerulea TaxID=218851 RepID=A0A2G5CEH1_AQUCA|nr:hypothetical protein AQUCO_05800054v1 [Aquilegia coerulea]
MDTADITYSSTNFSPKDQVVGIDDQEMREGHLHVLNDIDLEKSDETIYEGLTFESENEAYEQYYLYAWKVGFSVRKAKKYLRADGSVRSRIFVCSKEGERQKDKRCKYVRKERKDRIEKRTGCKARMVVKNRENEWIVSEIVHQHNHPLGILSKTITPLDDKDRKIRELSEELQREKKLRIACQNSLNQILKDIEEHTQNLSSKVEVAVTNMKELESDEQASPDPHRR